MNKRKTIIVVTTSLISIILAYFYYQLTAKPHSLMPMNIPPINNYPEPLPMESNNAYIHYLRGFILLLMTSLGIFFNILWQRKPNDQTPLLHLNNLKPLLISPIIFSSIYSSSQEITNHIAVLLFAFQNGFFWQGIFTLEETGRRRN